MHARMRKEYSRRMLLVGVDRLDYSKGLPHRILNIGVTGNPNQPH